ncbi:DUF2975 domain-containing protein [Aeromonas sp. MR19]|jgi:hypothetical protein|uniref:DUF2975 domain-containing protein n=1 Tax=Aeromonas TaxID=642 RepID=UPI000CD4193A|nr:MULTISPECIES: DUF2975 domain-containing protein [Aeromonas]EKP0276819.1 DUF2975 domain-containing protein [Aeromonas bestiarum]MCH7347865.1 DUF2975 domain-containing protein [Aeromonas sp. MR7]MCH7376642.1 DUF2975 domain-containing protein [Aeromonas sp. MR19]MDM5087405.1 DUF2975 domain-containing protein [Aeromonas bestiarum]POG24059.1 DUF2975 domain-containing protein [Aeromonas bestiarum]
MKYNKLERMSSLIEWILLFALLATPIMTVLGTWSHLLGGSDYLQDELISALAQEGDKVLNGVPLTMGEATAVQQAAPTPSLSDYPLDLGTRLLATLVMLLPDLVFMLILWQLHQLFRGYRHAMLFTFSQIRRYRLIGLLLCASFVTKIITTPLLDTVLTLPGPELHGTINIGSSDFQLLLAGLIVSALALVMREAKQLADEQQLTV